MIVTTKETPMTQQERITQLIEGMKANADAHGLDIRCPDCNAGIGKWCIGNERKAGPTDPNPSHQSRLIAAR
jgi:hypothetical protein